MSIDEVLSIEICTSQPARLPVVMLSPPGSLGLIEVSSGPPSGLVGSLEPLSRAMANTGNAKVHSRATPLDARD